MTLTITLNTEEQSALTDNLPANQDAETFLTNFVMGYVRTLAARAYDASVARLGEAARSLPYETRVALIAQVEAATQQSA